VGAGKGKFKKSLRKHVVLSPRKISKLSVFVYQLIEVRRGWEGCYELVLQCICLCVTVWVPYRSTLCTLEYKKSLHKPTTYKNEYAIKYTIP
jgi:hypothetical protein